MNENIEKVLRSKIRDIQDYPKKGVLFRDITPLLKDRDLFALCIDYINVSLYGKDIDYIAGIDARGFIIGSALAYKLKKGFIPIRKKGKLPYKTVEVSYSLEYAEKQTIEMHSDAVEKGSRVLIIDDVLSTGGTLAASIELLEKLDAKIAGICTLIELSALNGREKLKEYDFFTLLKY